MILLFNFLDIDRFSYTQFDHTNLEKLKYISQKIGNKTNSNWIISLFFNIENLNKHGIFNILVISEPESAKLEYYTYWLKRKNKVPIAIEPNFKSWVLLINPFNDFERNIMQESGDFFDQYIADVYENSEKVILMIHCDFEKEQFSSIRDKLISLEIIRCLDSVSILNPPVNIFDVPITL